VEPWGVYKIRADEAWPTVTGHQVVVAVVDTGVDHLHPDLGGRVIQGWDFVYDDDYPNDGNGHGTHVSGIVAAANDEYGVVGVAPECNILAVRVLDRCGSGWSSDVNAGIEYAADNGAHVINLSLGSEMPDETEEILITNAYIAGVITVASAGNDGDEDPIPPNYPGSYRHVIGVGSTTSADELSWFSSYGHGNYVSAPGSAILSTLPVTPDKIYEINSNGRCVPRNNWPPYEAWSGTSMAAPHVAGTFALVLQKNFTDTDEDGFVNGPTRCLEAYLTMRAVVLSGVDLGDPDYDPQFGFTRIDAKSAVDWTWGD
jgi:subtilisin family serine protease